MEEKLNPRDFDNISTKIYEDGKIGQYFCKCAHCNRTFVGHKRDVNCGKCVEENEKTKI